MWPWKKRMVFDRGYVTKVEPNPSWPSDYVTVVNGGGAGASEWEFHFDRGHGIRVGDTLELSAVNLGRV